MKNINL